MSVGYWETLATQTNDGPTLSAGTRASAIDNRARYTLAANRLRIGDILRVRAAGRLSTAVTTPGNSSWDLAAGVLGAIKIFDTLPITGNVTVQTNAPWWLEFESIVRTTGSGTSATCFGMGQFTSRAIIAAVAGAEGAPACAVPFNTAPVVGAGWDSTLATILDFCFTQTAATASQVTHNYSISLMTSSGF